MLIDISNIKEVILIATAIDMRKEFDGLLIVAKKYGIKLTRETAVLFVSRNRKMLKILVAHDNGLALMAKRFDRKRELAQVSFLEDASVNEITPEQLELVVGGKAFQTIPARSKVKKNSLV